jgi:hypothetical protein
MGGGGSFLTLLSFHVGATLKASVLTTLTVNDYVAIVVFDDTGMVLVFRWNQLRSRVLSNPTRATGLMPANLQYNSMPSRDAHSLMVVAVNHVTLPKANNCAVVRLDVGGCRKQPHSTRIISPHPSMQLSLAVAPTFLPVR